MFRQRNVQSGNFREFPAVKSHCGLVKWGITAAVNAISVHSSVGAPPDAKAGKGTMREAHSLPAPGFSSDEPRFVGGSSVGGVYGGRMMLC